MCTVSFVPTGNGFALSSNRDEKKFRKTHEPNWHIENGLKLFYPKDDVSGGTWIATNGKNKVVCLLNGAYDNHLKQDNYRKSRGVVLIDSFSYHNSNDFVNKVDLSNVEPFTLLLINKEERIEFIELVWDGNDKQISNIDVLKPHIWSSATLYSKEYIKIRKELFNQKIDFINSSSIEIKNFHLGNSIESEEHNFVMKRSGGMQKVSFTQIEFIDQRLEFSYTDLLQNSESKCILSN